MRKLQMMDAYPSDTSDKDDLYYAMSVTMKINTGDEATDSIDL